MLTDKIKDVLGTDVVDRLRIVRDQGAAMIAPVRGELLRRKLARRRLTLSDLGRFQSGVTVFFAPAAGVAPHFASHCILARTLQEMGHPVLLVGCFKAYPRCIVMEGSAAAARLSDRHPELVCLRCGNISADFTEEYGLDVLDLGAVLRPQDHEKINKAIAEAPADLTELKVDGIAFGNIAASAVSVSRKTLDFAGSGPTNRAAILEQVSGALVSYYAMQRLSEHVSISRIVCFSEYAMHLGAMVAAQAADIPISNMTHASSMAINRQRLALFDHPLAIQTYRDMEQQWPQWREMALPPERVDQIFDDILYRFTGDSAMVYSRARSGNTDALFDRLGLSTGKSVLVAFTSSLDEMFANRLVVQAMGAEPFQAEQPFVDQIDWLNNLIGWAEASERVQLVVRIHPREGGNRREPNSSEHLDLLRRHFDKPYRSTRIIWPQDDVSSYDLMEIADAGTASWSSTLVEMARLGVPSVMTFKGYTPIPVPDVVHWNADPAGYLKQVENVIETKPRLDLVTAAMRWRNVWTFGHTIDLEDVVPTPQFATLPPYRRPASAGIIEDVLIKGTRLLNMNLEALRRGQSATTVEMERSAVLRNLRRTIWLFTFGTEPPADYKLAAGSPDEDLPLGADVAAWVEGEHIVIRTRTTIVRRRSRLVERLFRMATEA